MNADTMNAPALSCDDEFAAGLAAAVTAAISSSIGAQLVEMRRFVDRRFAELSAEINASASIAEMSEATLVERISNVQLEMARLVSIPVAETRTSGLELEAVVQGTEIAANQILEAAEAIMDWAGKTGASEAATQINLKVQAIFEACSFQDLTSQRIRRAIHHLEQVDSMLNKIAAAEPLQEGPLATSNIGGTGADLDQDLIDQLMG
jgi:chemotaxis protein CheZ